MPFIEERERYLEVVGDFLDEMDARGRSSQLSHAGSGHAS
jgi:hypothetical protein